MARELFIRQALVQEEMSGRMDSPGLERETETDAKKKYPDCFGFFGTTADSSKTLKLWSIVHVGLTSWSMMNCSSLFMTRAYQTVFPVEKA